MGTATARVMPRLLPGSPGLRVMRLFAQRPGRLPLSLRQHKAMAHARALQLHGCGGRTAAWSWGDNHAPTVMLVHGWGGCAAQRSEEHTSELQSL